MDDTQSKNVVFISQCSRYDSMLQMKNGQRNDYINWVLTEMIEYLAYQLVVDKSSASVDAKVESKNLSNATKDDKKELGLVRKGFEGTTFQSGITTEFKDK